MKCKLLKYLSISLIVVVILFNSKSDVFSACTYEGTITGNRVNFSITSDVDKLAVVQYIRQSGSAMVTNMYGPDLGIDWSYSADPTCNISLNTPIGCRQNRGGSIGNGAFWQWYDWPTQLYHQLPNGVYGLDFDVAPTYDSVGIMYGVIPGTVADGETWTLCTRTGDVSTPTTTATATATPTTTATATATSTATATATSTSAPTPTPMGVPNLKQFEGGWENNIYDHTVKTIKDWGCALTSAAMVLRYHGHNVWPNTLNDWLNGQKDGYIRNGLINWLAVSRYTKIHDSAQSPTLMYKRLLPSNINLGEEINNLRPAILKEDGHFIVATGKTIGSYFINDPGYATRNTLESYGNNFLAINSYTPTHSDLSYMMFVVDENINLELLDLEGNIIETQKFVEDPIIDTDDLTSKSGEPLSLLILEKPTNGRYILKISGISGDYHLESYLYNRDGLVTYNTFFGILFGDDFDTYQINYSSQSQTYLTLDEIINDLNNAYQNKLLKNKGVYQSIKMHLKIYSKIESEMYMKLVIKQIKSLTPELIDPDYSLILQQNLESLISE